MRLILADERHGKSSVPKKEALLDADQTKAAMFNDIGLCRDAASGWS
jgi:hypothetical protein